MSEVSSPIYKQLYNGMFLILDRSFEYLLDEPGWNAYAPRSTSTWYVQRKITLEDGRRTSEQFHRRLLSDYLGRPLLTSEKGDHKNGNGLDNRLENLRLVSNAENLANRIGLRATNTSGFRGVVKSRNKWAAIVKINGIRNWLGCFTTAEEANEIASAYRLKNMPGALN